MIPKWFLSITRENWFWKGYIRSYSKKESQSKALQGQVLNSTASIFLFSREHRFGSVLNWCGLAKIIAKIDSGNFKVRGFIFCLKFSHRDFLIDFTSHYRETVEKPAQFTAALHWIGKVSNWVFISPLLKYSFPLQISFFGGLVNEMAHESWSVGPCSYAQS